MHRRAAVFYLRVPAKHFRQVEAHDIASQKQWRRNHGLAHAKLDCLTRLFISCSVFLAARLLLPAFQFLFHPLVMRSAPVNPAAVRAGQEFILRLPGIFRHLLGVFRGGGLERGVVHQAAGEGVAEPVDVELIAQDRRLEVERAEGELEDVAFGGFVFGDLAVGSK